MLLSCMCRGLKWQLANGKMDLLCETAVAPAGIISQLLQPAMVAAVGADQSAALAAADALRALAALEATAPGSLQAVLCEVSQICTCGPVKHCSAVNLSLLATWHMQLIVF